METELKKGWIHHFRLKSGPTNEGLFCGNVNGVTVWESLDFAVTSGCPRFVPIEDVEWAKPIIEDKPDTTFYDYRRAIKEVCQ